MSKDLEQAAEDYAFQVPYNGTNDFYNIEKLKAFKAGAEWKQDNWISVEEKPEQGQQVLTKTADKVYRVISYGSIGGGFPSDVILWQPLT